MSGQGSFIWIELATSDVPAAIDFYKHVVGWNAQKFDGPMPYFVLDANGQGIGGVMGFTDEVRETRWVGYVKADDVDALTKKAVALDAKTCVPPHDIPGVGRISMVADPQGAELAMIAPQGPDRPPPEQPSAGQVVWHELLCNDVERELRFYGDLLGWRQTGQFDMGPNGLYRIYGKDGRDFGGMMKRPQGYPLPPHFLHYVHVGDLDAAVERVKDGGGKVWMGPTQIPSGMRIAQGQDPQGAVFALHGA
jgi:predicted enzyme related to lactoylglutathione lyase